MTDKPTVGRAASTTKRKSLLSELGIKTGDAAAPGTAPTPKPRTTTTPSLNRRPSTTVKPSSPSVSKTRTSPSAPPRKVAPAPVKVDRTTKISSSVASPTSPSPNRRSIVPSSQRSSTVSPLARRASVNVGSPNGSTVANKRISSPAGLDSLQEVQTMKEQLDEQELQLKKKQEEIDKLKEIESNLKSENEQKVSQLLAEIEHLKQTSTLKEIKEDDENEVKLRLEMDATENKHKSEMEKLLETQEQKLQYEIQALTIDYEKQIESLKATYENQHQVELEKIEKEKSNYVQQLIQEQTMHENYKKEQEVVIADLKKQLAAIEEAQSSSHARKVENELVATTAALEDLRRQSQQATESLERRYRDEIRQLQSGSDDTAQAWLEKTRSAQQQVDQLHDELSRKDSTHKQELEQLTEQHTLEIDELQKMCENKESQIEEQSSQIEDLLFQVDTLQNSLEAATVRLEHTAKSTPTTSSNREDINTSVNGIVNHDPIKNIHQECLNRIDVKQKELEDLKKRLKEIKDTHESQINRLGQEKANAINELRKTIIGLEQRLAATPPTTPTKSTIDEDRLISIAEQHRKEIKAMHDQYQIVVDTKDRELEDYAYRVKALVASKQKEIEKLNAETNATIDKYERDIEGYESKIIEYEKQSIKLQDKITHWETLTHNNEALIQDMKKGCVAHCDENAQLIRLVNQLQSELHS